jgi:uncharacterized protein YjbJ (UPF0337 family)
VCRGRLLQVPAGKSDQPHPDGQARRDLSEAEERSNCRLVGRHLNSNGGIKMDWNRVEGNWKQFKGAAKEKWGKLTDDDLNVIEGRREQLEGKLQQRYGFAKDQIHRDVDDWFRTLK